MGNPDYYPPLAPVGRPLFAAVMLFAAAALMVAGSFLTIADMTQHLVGGATFGDTKSQVSVTTYTAWSSSSPELGDYLEQPFDGWADVAAGAFAVVVAVLLVSRRGAWAKPLAALAAGVLVGVALMSVLNFAELMGTAGTTKDMSIDMAAGAAVWLQIPAGVLALVVAMWALTGNRPPQGYMASQIAM
jgi:hypothetical protein